MLLLPFLLIALAALRFVRNGPAYAAKCAKPAEEALFVWYRAILTLLECADVPIDERDTPVTLSQKAASMGRAGAHFGIFAVALSEKQYACAKAKPEIYREAALAYRETRKKAGLKARLRFARLRLTRGMRRTDRLP